MHLGYWVYYLMYLPKLLCEHRYESLGLMKPTPPPKDLAKLGSSALSSAGAKTVASGFLKCLCLPGGKPLVAPAFTCSSATPDNLVLHCALAQAYPGSPHWLELI